jgi:hypothetical protein
LSSTARAPATGPSATRWSAGRWPSSAGPGTTARRTGPGPYLLGEVAGLGGQDGPDPYYGEAADFAQVLGLLETGMASLAGPLTVLLEA